MRVLITYYYLFIRLLSNSTRTNIIVLNYTCTMNELLSFQSSSTGANIFVVEKKLWNIGIFSSIQ